MNAANPLIVFLRTVRRQRDGQSRQVRPPFPWPRNSHQSSTLSLPMKEIPSEEMSMLQGGFAPLAPDPPLPGPSGDLEDELRALQDYWNHLLVANHRGYAD